MLLKTPSVVLFAGIIKQFLRSQEGVSGVLTPARNNVLDLLISAVATVASA
jgi:hypothetical protein